MHGGESRATDGKCCQGDLQRCHRSRAVASRECKKEKGIEGTGGSAR